MEININSKTEIVDDHIIMKESKSFKKNTLKNIKKKSYNVEYKRLKDNYKFLEKLYLDLIYYVACNEASIAGFIEKYKEAAFLFNVGYRGTSFNSRNNFDIFIQSKADGSVYSPITIEAWSGRIVSSKIQLPESVYDVFDLEKFIYNDQTIESSYDWKPLDHELGTHFADIKLGNMLILSAIDFIQKRDPKKAWTLKMTYDEYIKNASKRQCIDKEEYFQKLAEKKAKQEAINID